MASAAGSHAKTVRVCDPCHRRKVSCDLARPTCTACAKYSRTRPEHVCTYGPSAAFPGETKQLRESSSGSAEDEVDEGSLDMAGTRSWTRRVRMERKCSVENGEAATGSTSSEMEDNSSSLEDSFDDDKPARPVPSRLLLATTFPTFPSTLPALPPFAPRCASPVPSPITPPTPYFTSVFSPLPSPEILISSAPAISPRPSSTEGKGGLRRASFPDHEVLLARDFLSEAQRGLARLSVSPPMTAGHEAYGETARPLELEGQFEDVFAWA
ncbi:hypothetical protein JCM11251_001159 [Rhodosporidiobolus azoricus]